MNHQKVFNAKDSLSNHTKLHKLPRESLLRIYESEDGKATNATFRHLNGMYSYCTTEDGRTLHLSAITPMVLKDGRWEIDDTSESKP